MKQSVLKALGVLLLGVMPYLGYADVPGTISFQGFLLDDSRQPVDGERDITFSMPGTAWVELQTGVPVKQGVFSVQLGSQTPFAGLVDFSQMPQWLQIEVNGATRTVPLSSVPYAFHAQTLAGGVPQGPPGPQGPQGERGESYWELKSNALHYANGNVVIDNGRLRISHSNGGHFSTNSEDGGLELASGNDPYSYIDFKGNSQLDSDYEGRIYFNNGKFGFKGGDVGINKIPQYTLDVAGIIRGNNVSTSSDKRLKQNIQPLENATAKLAQLRGVSFEWKDNAHDAGTQVGLIAQEVEKVLPELVSTDGEGYKSIAYGKLTAVLVEAVKEQQQRIEQKDQKIATLETTMQQKTATIAEQQDRIAKLEAMMQRMAQQMAVLNQTVDTLKATVQTQPQPQVVPTRLH